MEAMFDEVRALALLVAANAVPLIVGKLARHRGVLPLDFGYVMRDGERLFGSHKTWRGLISGTIACSLVGAYLGLNFLIGAGFGLVSLLADAASSAVKRRLGFKPGTERVGLDHAGESILPLLLFAGPLSIGLTGILLVTISFVLLDVATASLRHRTWLP
jgi:CDP-2,3-bis-(O-geranylgeranyl)-sn-glycerol synthase